jgi:hypothetical protein
MAAEIDEVALAKCLEHARFGKQIPDLLRRAHSAYLSAPKKRLSQGGD